MNNPFFEYYGPQNKFIKRWCNLGTVTQENCWVSLTNILPKQKIHNYNGKAELTDDRRTKQIQAQLK